VASNLSISVQRRYLNMMADSGRQQQIEMFLGMQHARDFPSVPACGVHRVVSRPPSALLLKPTPAATATLLPQVEPQTRLDPIELDASGWCRGPPRRCCSSPRPPPQRRCCLRWNLKPGSTRSNLMPQGDPPRRALPGVPRHGPAV
jgi:hypothetical protein